MLVGIFTDLTALRRDSQRELEAANQRLHDLAHLDRLTGLPNRMYFEETRWHAKWPPRRASTSTFAVLFMDLNGFKDINDTYGHSAGDELIRSGSARGWRRLHGARIFWRGWAATSLWSWWRGTPTRADARRLAERLAAIIDQARSCWPPPRHTGDVSIGVAVFPHDGAHSDELTKNCRRGDVSRQNA